MSTTRSLHHFVFNTYMRRMTIAPAHERELYAYIWSIIKERHCKLLRINGIGNHIHILADLHPSICVSNFAGEIKRKSSLWMKRCGLFPSFEGWGKEYYAFSISSSDIERVIQYIKGQKEHHGVKSFDSEMLEMLISEGMGEGDLLP